MQADPFIQAPKNSQSHNRYAYVINNPLKYTDPSGYLFGIWAHSKAQQKTFKALGPEASGILIGFASAACGLGAPACARYLSYNNAKAQGASTTGALKASFVAAATVYALQEIGVVKLGEQQVHQKTFFRTQWLEVLVQSYREVNLDMVSGLQALPQQRNLQYMINGVTHLTNKFNVLLLQL